MALNGGGTIGRQVGRVEEDLLGGWRGGWRGRVEGGGGVCVYVCVCM